MESTDIEIVRGDAFGRTVKLVNPNGSRIDLTGATATAQIRSGYGDTAPVVTFTTSISAPEDQGVITMSLTNSDTLLLVDDRYIWSCQVQFVAGDRKTFLRGFVDVLGKATQP